MYFKNGDIIMEASDHKSEAFEEFRVAIYDGLTPLSKVIGFKVGTAEGVAAGATERHKHVVENMLELSATFSKLIFLPYELNGAIQAVDKVVVTDSCNGQATTENAHFRRNGMPMRTLNKDYKLFYSLGNVSMYFLVAEKIGYVPMEECVDSMTSLSQFGINPSTYFPVHNEFTLIDYVRVLPPVIGNYKYTLHNGMTDEELNVIWKRYQVVKALKKQEVV